MNRPALTESEVMWGLARIAAAGLMLPDFLVLKEEPGGVFRWLDADLVAVARQWQARACGEDLAPEAFSMVEQIALVLDERLNAFIDLHAHATATQRQRGWTVWRIRRQLVIAWLGQSGLLGLNAAARAWQPAPASADAATVSARIDALPELSGLRALLRRHLDAPPVLEEDTREVRRVQGT